MKSWKASIGMLLVLASSAYGQQFSSQGELQTPVEQQGSNQTLELPAQFKGCWSGVYSVTVPGFGVAGPSEEVQLCFTPTPTLKGVRAQVDKVGPGWVQLDYSYSGQSSTVDFQEAGKVRCRFLADSGRVSCDFAGVRTQKISGRGIPTGGYFANPEVQARAQQFFASVPAHSVPNNYSVTMDKE